MLNENFFCSCLKTFFEIHLHYTYMTDEQRSACDKFFTRNNKSTYPINYHIYYEIISTLFSLLSSFINTCIATLRYKHWNI